MVKKLLALLFVSVLVLPLSTTAFAQAASKEGRCEGVVARSNPDKSTLRVRKAFPGTSETTVEYDSSTKWVSQYHGDKKVNDIDASQVKDGDYVICKGSADGSVIHATLISKRLAHGNANQ